MKYISRPFSKDLGFTLTDKDILNASNDLNEFMMSLPVILFKKIDFKTLGAMIGAMFCSYVEAHLNGAAIVNPIEKGYPDIIPFHGKNAPESELRNYPLGLEIKGTVGNIEKGLNLKGGEQRIYRLANITWQAHHQQVNNVLGIIWDFCNPNNNFLYPAITGAFFSGNLNTDDWGEISGTTGRNTKVCGMLRGGKLKMGDGWILIWNSPEYINRYCKILDINLNSLF